MRLHHQIAVSVCEYVCERTSYYHSHANNSKHKNALVTAEVYSLLKRIEMKIVFESNALFYKPSKSVVLNNQRHTITDSELWLSLCFDSWIHTIPNNNICHYFVLPIQRILWYFVLHFFLNAIVSFQLGLFFKNG